MKVIVHTARETYELETDREVTHAVVAINHKGEEVVTLTRSPKSAVSQMCSGGYAARQDVTVFEITDGIAK